MKETNYKDLLQQIKSLTQDQKYLITLLSNTSALLMESLEDLNWVGYYLIKDDQLILGPFQGKVACEIIQIGKGVCGTAVKTKQTQLVYDVHQFEGHIACDSASNSEIVIPIFIDGKVFGVLDIDSPSIGRFDEIDKKYLEEITQVITEAIIKCEN